jgi:2,5-diamino-6-(ribosylamino)-4(3H)-pyrimidinone 5'-phosphate reductase
MSLDGKIALPTKKPIKLSSLEDFKRVHELRNYCDAILVGVNTIILDDPKLTVKPEFVIKPTNPIRIILDSTGRIPKNAQVLDDKAQTYIIMGDEYKDSDMKFENAEILYCQMANPKEIALDKLLPILKNKGIDNLLVEGGETVIFSFFKNNLVDEIYVYISSVIIGGTTSPTLAGGEGITQAEKGTRLKLYSIDRLGDGVLLKYIVN